MNSGPPIIGSFGGQKFFDYMAYRDAVNIAARLEQANKIVGTRICMGKSVADKAPDFPGRQIGTPVLKGKSQAIRCFEPRDQRQSHQDADKPDTYLNAFTLLEENDPKATQAFAAMIAQNTEDALAAYYLGRLLNGETGCDITL